MDTPERIYCHFAKRGTFLRHAFAYVVCESTRANVVLTQEIYISNTILLLSYRRLTLIGEIKISAYAERFQKRMLLLKKIIILPDGVNIL